MIPSDPGGLQREFMRSKWLARFLCLSFVMALMFSCGDAKERPKQPPPVTVSLPRTEPVADYYDLTGTVSAFRSVDLVARVAGYLQSVNFSDGTDVKRGQLLFVIEPKPYMEQLKLNQASFLRAKSEYRRQLRLIKQDATSVANVEKWRSERDQAAAQAALAKIKLGYTRVTASFSGRIGRHLVDPGNMVGVDGHTKLATLDQISPIYVYFNMNERDALRIRDAVRRPGKDTPSEMGEAPVWVGLLNEEGYPHRGSLDFIDIDFNTDSGTIQMRAVLTNKERVFLPGLFARVRIPLGKPKPMLVVPNRAVCNDQAGDYVLVVGANDRVARRSVVKGFLAGGDRAIMSGLTATDRVIVKGIANAGVGSRVTPQSEAGSAKPIP